MNPDPEAARDRESRGNRYLNREIGLLRFQQRVLAEAQNPANPLLERVKFLSIVGSNLDEFFMVRVGGLVMQQRAGISDLSIDGKTPAEQLAALRLVAEDILCRATDLWHDDLRPALAHEGIHILDYPELNDKQRQSLEEYFQKSIFPVLTPQSFDPGHPFPHISNLSLNLAVIITDPQGEDHFARVKVPSALPRLVPLKKSSGGQRKDGTVPHHHWFVPLEQVIVAHLDQLFTGNTIKAAHPFYVTRNADIALQEMDATDLLETMSENLHSRRFSPVINLSLERGTPKNSRRILVQNLMVNRNDIYELRGPLALSHLMHLYDVDRYDLKEKVFKQAATSFQPLEGGDADVFNAIRSGDILVHHPYQSYDPVIEFLKAAVRDPQVLAIKQTLYRVGPNSPVVKYLREARRVHRKQVTVLVELKARFDEASNIGWARMLEREGVHVIYGMVGLKTHAKTLLIVRREGNELRRYAHLGTGNYNAGTAKVYEDLGLFTCDEAIGADLTDLFNYLTGLSNISDFRKLLVAPLCLRAGFEKLVRREIDHAAAGRSGHLVFKCNSLVDRQFIDLLYEASAAGVKIDLLVRGLCALRPEVPGLSENIKVRSVVGRFLEHSRIYYFHNDGEPEIYLGSADLMTRNLDHRVETLFPLRDPEMITRLRERVLDLYLAEDSRAWRMQSDGTYLPPGHHAPDGPLRDVHGEMLQRIHEEGT
jgi:polyphosphate kinase